MCLCLESQSLYNINIYNGIHVKRLQPKHGSLCAEPAHEPRPAAEGHRLKGARCAKNGTTCETYGGLSSFKQTRV